MGGAAPGLDGDVFEGQGPSEREAQRERKGADGDGERRAEAALDDGAADGVQQCRSEVLEAGAREPGAGVDSTQCGHRIGDRNRQGQRKTEGGAEEAEQSEGLADQESASVRLAGQRVPERSLGIPVRYR